MRFRRAFLLFGLAAALGLAQLRETTANNLSPAQSLVVLMAKEKAADSPRLLAFIDKAPELSSFPLRAGVSVAKFAPSWDIVDDLELPNGTLYVSVEPPLPAGVAAGEVPQQVGTLRNGVFSQIKLPAKALAVGFIGTLGGSPVITTVAPPGRYVINNSVVERLSEAQKLDVRENGTNFTLHDESSCSKGPIGSTAAVVTHRTDGSHVLVTTAAVQRAFGWPIHVDPLSIICATFGGDDYLNINSYLIFQLQRGQLKLVARGRIWASGPHRILMTAESLPSDPHPSYYLEATAP